MDAVVDGQTGILFPAGDPDALATALKDLDRARLATLAEGVAQHKRTHGWTEFADCVAELATSISSARGGRA